eukprot:409731-Alexandrium_andersonii.AAC.1
MSPRGQVLVYSAALAEPLEAGQDEAGPCEEWRGSAGLQLGLKLWGALAGRSFLRFPPLSRAASS